MSRGGVHKFDTVSQQNDVHTEMNALHTFSNVQDCIHLRAVLEVERRRRYEVVDRFEFCGSGIGGVCAICKGLKGPLLV